MDGKRRTPVSPAVVAGEGRRILPANESFIDRGVLLRAYRNALLTEKTRLVHGRIALWVIHPKTWS
jgi:hypothetical protein